MSQKSPFEACQECGAPMDHQQRYCVSCATRRVDVANPTSQYFAQATRNRTRAARPVEAAGEQKSGSRAASVIFFALLPIAVAVGVLVGQGNGDGGGGTDTAALSKILAAQNTGAAASDAGGATASTSDTSTASNGATQPIVSDFSLDKGFAVSVGTVPIKGATKAAVSKAESAAEKKGAKNVGVIDPTKFVIKPTPAAGNYILYTGEYKSRGDAEKALNGLKQSFPKAEVISVSSSTDSTGSKVLAKTDHGTVHQVTDYKPPPAKVQQDTQTVNDIANDTGSDYVQAQQNLPDIVTIGGDPSTAPPLPTGAGD